MLAKLAFVPNLDFNEIIAAKGSQMHHKVLIEEKDGWVEIYRADSKNAGQGIFHGLFDLSGKFTRLDFVDSAKATGNVFEQSGGFLASEGCSKITEDVDRILQYFHRSDQPTESIERTREVIDQYGEAGELNDFEVAWADVLLREKLADAARTSNDVWSVAQLVVDTEPHIEAVLSSLFERKAAQADAMQANRILANALSRKRPQQKRKVG